MNKKNPKNARLFFFFFTLEWIFKKKKENFHNYIQIRFNFINQLISWEHKHTKYNWFT